MVTIRYILRTDKPLKSGQFPLDLLYQVKGQRKYYRTNIKLFEKSWDQEKHVVYLDKKTVRNLLPGINYDLLPTAKDVQKLNKDIELLNSSIETIERNFHLSKIDYSSQMVVDKLKEENRHGTKKETQLNVLFDFIDQYINDNKATRQTGSLSVYKSVKHFKTTLLM